MNVAINIDHCCIFCYRTFTKEVTPKEKGDENETQARFLLLLKRYLIHGCDADSGNWMKFLSDSIESCENLRKVISPCADCSGIIKSFCEYYEEMKILEMKLKWRLKTLSNIVKSSEKVNSRRKVFQDKLEESKEYEGLNVSDIMNQLKSFRTDFVLKCAGRLEKSYPKLELRRYDFSGLMLRPVQKWRHDQNILDCNQDKKVPRLDEIGTVSPLHEVSNEPCLKVEPLLEASVPFKLKEGKSVIETRAAIDDADNKKSDTRSTCLKNTDSSALDISITGNANAIKLEPVKITHEKTTLNGTAEASMELNKGQQNLPNASHFDVVFPQSQIDVGLVKIAQHFESSNETFSETSAVESESQESFLNNGTLSTSDAIDETEPSTEQQEVAPSRRTSLRQRFPCTSCSQKFSSSKKLKEHVEACVSCESSYDEVSETNQYQSSENDIKSMDIDDDDDDLSHEMSMNKHVSVKTGNMPCCFCSETFSTRASLIFHQNQVHQKIQPDWKAEDSKFLPKPNKNLQVFQCPEDDCNEKFYNSENLDAHSLLHGDFKCKFCNETRAFAPNLALHEASSHKLENVMIKRRRKEPRSGSNSNSYSCARCDFVSLAEIYYVQHHLESHLNLKMIMEKVCCICKVAFKSDRVFRKAINRHYATFHQVNSDNDNPNAVYHCRDSKCEGVYFLTEKQLNFHKRLIHHEILRKFPCDLCHKVFYEAHKLNHHRMMSHKKELSLPIPCSRHGCFMRFDNEESLKLHLSRKHSGKNQLCPHCGKSYQGRVALSIHIRMAHKSGPPKLKPKETSSFVCPECGKIFGNKTKLDQHILKVHVGPQGWKYTCNTCGKKCVTTEKLEEHERTHTKEKPFTCEHCGLSYSHRHNFRHHLKNKHGIDLNDARRNRKNP